MHHPQTPPPAPNAADMTGLVHRPGSFVAGLAGGQGLDRVAKAIIQIVDASFDSHPMRGGSKSGGPEWRARRDYLVAKFRELQGDLKWTTDRALSMLRPCLLAELDGRPSPVTPRSERGTLWVPDTLLVQGGSIRVDDVADAPSGPEGGIESLDELKDDVRRQIGAE